MLPPYQLQHMINDLVSTTAITLAFFAQIWIVFGSRSSRGDRYDLLALRDSLSSTANLHLNWTGPPCRSDRSHWFGITCSDSRVVGISLTGIQLTGSLPPAAFQDVARLANLSLGNNALRGGLPTLRGLQQLRIVSFSGNRFTGSIPIEYTFLPNLSRLELDDNLLDGTIPAFEQESLTALNVSYNFLHGRIPETSALRRFSKSSYGHNLGLCGKILDEPCVAAPPCPSPGGEGFGLSSMVLVAVCAVVVTVMIISCFWLLYVRYQKKGRDAADYSGEVSSDLVMNKARVPAGRHGREKFTLEFLDKEGASFDLDSLLGSSAEIIEKGMLGSAYKITLDSGAEVVVKRLNDIGGLSRKDFFRQMQLLGKLRHDNLVAITAFYYSHDEKFVVYENVPGCSLFQLIHENRGEGRVPLKWAARLSIAKGTVRGLAYLHASLPSHRVPHGDLKSSNVVVVVRNGHSYHPKLTHFGFLPLLPSPHQAHRLAVGRTPEFSRGRKLARESDLYCLGLILLEIVTGRVLMEEEDSTQWVWSLAENVPLIDLLDLELVADKEAHRDMQKLVQIALDCTALEPQRRPKLTELVERIEAI